MNNLKLNTKLLLLTILLLSITVLIAWIGASRLRVLDAKVQQLGDQTIRKTIAAGDMRAKLLLAILAQKNAILATTDQGSLKDAEASRKWMSEVSQDLRSLSTLVSDASEQDLLGTFREAYEELGKVNEECLVLAVQNTNLKGANELYGRTHESVKRILEVLKGMETAIRAIEPKVPANEATALAVQGLASDAQELVRVAGEHLATSATDSKFADLDQRFKDLLEQLPKAAEKIQEGCRTANVSSGDLSSSVSTLRASLTEIIRLSTLDTNNRSTEISLTTGKDRADTTMAAIDELVAAFNATAEKDVVESRATYDQGLIYIVAGCVAGLAVGFGASVWISRSITDPINVVRNVTRSMSTGDLGSRIHLTQTDEVGELATATDALADALTDIIQEIQKTSMVLAESSSGLGQISASLVGQSQETSMRSNGVAAAAEELSTNINTMSAAAEQMSMNFSSISSATEELSTSVGAISSAAEQTSSNVTNVAGAVKSISSSFGDVLNDVKEGARVAGEASQMAESAGRTMRDLDQSSTEISKFTETIKMIALQTNLLALNATIEATSAGEAGKGFAVVAHEIKELANQSAKAAEDIAKKIEGVQSGTRQAVGVIREIADVIKNINQSADRISSSVENQNRSAQTISQNISEANQGVGHIARSISEVASTANMMARNIAEASRGAVDVSRNVGEAARASSGISESITQVSAAARDTNSSASGVTEAAKQLDQIAGQLRNLIAKFKIPHHGKL